MRKLVRRFIPVITKPDGLCQSLDAGFVASQEMPAASRARAPLCVTLRGAQTGPAGCWVVPPLDVPGVAFLSVALAMRTQDMDNEYESASLFRFVKQRDFEPKPSSFEVTTSRETCRMTFVDGSAGAVVTLGNTANKDGKDDAAVALMKANHTLSGVKLAKLLKDGGIERSKEWVRLKRLELGLGGVKIGNTL